MRGEGCGVHRGGVYTSRRDRRVVEDDVFHHPVFSQNTTSISHIAHTRIKINLPLVLVTLQRRLRERLEQPESGGALRLRGWARVGDPRGARVCRGRRRGCGVAPAWVNEELSARGRRRDHAGCDVHVVPVPVRRLYRFIHVELTVPPRVFDLLTSSVWVRDVHLTGDAAEWRE